jgi:ribosomal protein L4
MGYSQNPLNVLKGQMTNKAVGLAHGDSMAMQVDVKSGEELKEFVGTGTQTSFKKDDIKKVLEGQKQYDKNIESSTRNLAEIDSLKREARGQGDSAKHFYGHNYTANMPVPTGKKDRPFKNERGTTVYDSHRTEKVASREKNLEKLREEARNIAGPRPTI